MQVGQSLDLDCDELCQSGLLSLLLLQCRNQTIWTDINFGFAHLLQFVEE